MKIERLIGILSVLLQQERVTAPYLAEKFEVSRRTINRDIEALCGAGIPVVTSQGQGGGISIMEGYRLDKTLLTSADMQAILTGLKGLDSVSGNNQYQQLMDKLNADNTTLASNNHILIDLASYYKPSLAPKISLLQTAIEQQHYVRFVYCSPGGEGERLIEPYLLVFQWSSWYIWGWCMKREDYRIFKLNRIQELTMLERRFEKRKVPPYEVKAETAFPAKFWIKAVFEPEMKWRLIEEFGAESFAEMEDGRLLFRFHFHDEQNLFSWLLSFGDKVELLEPECLREQARRLLKNMLEKYEGEDDI